MKYKCIDCDFTFESSLKKNPLIQKARDHLFFNEHHGFVKVKETEEEE